ncbi:translation initiation factor IF-2-like [Cygnus atratus]|uniref:translation initiation factor IF-2-like n=1 Tax=Cygnus atratus TaxID=8868 RepID=UPI0021B8487A|nr:translation initiation factor IF-2-like [Cygnus atratus]
MLPARELANQSRSVFQLVTSVSPFLCEVSPASSSARSRDGPHAPAGSRCPVPGARRVCPLRAAPSRREKPPPGTACRGDPDSTLKREKRQKTKGLGAAQPGAGNPTAKPGAAPRALRGLPGAGAHRDRPPGATAGTRRTWGRGGPRK